MDPSVKENLVKSSNAFNSISLISSFLVLASFSVVALYRPRLINRTTLRLQAAISLFDFLNAFFALFHHSVKSGGFCTFIGFWRNFGEQMYCLLNVMIALNLQLIFLHNKMPNKRWEITYWASSLLVAFILSIVPLGLGFYGVGASGLCYINERLPGASTMIFVDTSLFYLLTFVYVLVIAVLVIAKLSKTESTIKLITRHDDNAEVNGKINSSLRKLIFRISLYPLACLFGLSGFIVGYIITLSGAKNPLGVTVWGMVGITTKGLINMVTFFLDPTFQEAIKATYYNFRNKDLGQSLKFDAEANNQHELNSAFTINENGDKILEPSGKFNSYSQNDAFGPEDLKRFL